MTRGAAQLSAPEPRPPIPISLWSMFCVAAAGTTLLWLPLTVLPILDGLLFVAPLREVLRDLGLLGWLGLLPAAALATLARAVTGVTGLAGIRAAKAALTGWTVLLLPLTWVCGWQAARTGWQWARAVLGVDLVITPAIRSLAMLALAMVIIWTIRRVSLVATVQRIVAALLAAQWLAMGLLAASLCLVLAHPPAMLPSASTPSALKPQATAPVVIVIAVDSLAWPDADPCNPASATMPRLAAFASYSSCFKRFYAASNFTTPTTSTMDSGLLPWTHLATQPDATMAMATRGHTLASVLQTQGWRTHSITDNLLASPRHRGTFAAYTSTAIIGTSLIGNQIRGLMSAFPDTALPRLAATALSFMGAFDIAQHGDRSPFDTEKTYTEARALLAREGRQTPLFIWIQPFPPHAPYLPPPSTKYRLLPRGQLDDWRDLMMDNAAYTPNDQKRVDQHRLRYRESVMAADASLGKFLDDLDRQGLLDSALVVVTSDHGESFEKGYLSHAGPLTHDSLIHVPLVVKLPGQKFGQTLNFPVSQADLAPTLLDMVGAPPLPHAEGRSLRAALEGKPLPPKPVFSMTMERQSRFEPIRYGRYVVIDGNDKLTLALDPKGNAQAEKVTLFDLAADPGETHDLAQQRPERSRELQTLLRSQLAEAEKRRIAGLQ